MQVLVFNAGSSSLKFGIYSVGAETREVLKGSYERFQDGECVYRLRHGEIDESESVSFGNPSEALRGVPAILERFGLAFVNAVGTGSCTENYIFSPRHCWTNRWLRPLGR